MRGEARISKRALFGDLGYVPHEGQIAVHRSRALRRVLACGVRWGKTRCATMEVVAALVQPVQRETLGWVVAPDHSISDRILTAAHALLERHVPSRVLGFKGHSLRVRNLAGQVAVAEGRSADNPSSLLGEGLDWLVVDEAARIKDDVWNEHLAQRLVERRGWALIVSTPRGRGWFHDAYRRGRSSEDPDYEAWTGPTWNNPHIDREAIEAERRRLEPDTFAQEFEGKFVGSGIPQCETCGYPRSEWGPSPVLTYPEKLGTCSACGHYVMEDGRAVAIEWGGVISERWIELRPNIGRQPPPFPDEIVEMDEAEDLGRRQNGTHAR